MFNSRYKIINNLINSDDSHPKISLIVPLTDAADVNKFDKDRIQIRNLFKTLRNSHELDSEVAKAVKSAESLLMSNKVLSNQHKSLAAYISRENIQWFGLALETTPVVYCNDEFFVTPLLIDRSLGYGMYAFHLSLNSPKLYIFDGNSLQESEEIDLPTSLEDALNIDEYVKEKQHHVAANAQHHGQGASDNRNSDIEVFIERLANKLDKFLAGKSVPLLVAGTEERVASLKEHLNYDHLIDEAIYGNFDDQQEDLLQRIESSALQSVLHEIKAYEKHLKAKNSSLILDNKVKIKEATQLGQVKDLAVPLLRWTKDSVSSTNAKQALLDFANCNIAALDEMVRNVVSQGGSIKVVSRSIRPKINTDFLATLRYQLT